jgi:hypothetical protein
MPFFLFLFLIGTGFAIAGANTGWYMMMFACVAGILGELGAMAGRRR